MSLKHSTIQKTCEEFSKSIAESYPGLQSLIIPHRTGMLEDNITAHEEDILKHPAGRTALRMLNAPASSRSSAFIGIAACTTSRLFGIIKKHHLLGLITLNSDMFEDLTQALSEIYHLNWHAIDMAMHYRKPAYGHKLQNGPLVPKRSPLNLARANMQADVFAAAMLHFDGHEDAPYKIASLRARQALEAKSGKTPENYPFVICYESTHQALEDIGRPGIPKHKMIDTARKLSLDIGAIYDESAIRQWWGFCIPAQDMVWRGTLMSDILNAAVNTSNDAFVRAIGILMSEITGIETQSDIQLEDKYNAYSSTAHNQELHKRKMDETFEIVIAEGLQKNSSRPFLDAANDQNIELSRGHIMGWCASALHAAAQAFDSAENRGRSPDRAARLEFHSMESAASWDLVNELGQEINNQRRQGHTVTLSDIQRLCENDKRFKDIKKSLQNTLNDPEYQKQYSIARKLNISPELQPGAAPGNAPNATPEAPAAMPAATPALGGGSGMRLPGQRQNTNQPKRQQDAKSSHTRQTQSGQTQSGQSGTKGGKGDAKNNGKDDGRGRQS